MDEVWLAVGKGYRILKLYDVYECPVTQYNYQTGEVVLSVAY